VGGSIRKHEFECHIEDYNDEWNQPGDYGTFSRTEVFPSRARAHLARGAGKHLRKELEKFDPDLIT